MISDILYEALKEIQELREEFPSIYADAEIKADIDDVVARMDALRQKLDTCPT
jgi:uncharacterized coiled-coil DUF342 family protein